MRKFLFILGALSLFAFMSCQQPTEETSHSIWENFEDWGSEDAKRVYSYILGSWKSMDSEPDSGINIIVIESNSMTINSTSYKIDQNSDIIYLLDNKWIEDSFFSEGLYVRLGDKYLGFCSWSGGNLIDTLGLVGDLGFKASWYPTPSFEYDRFIPITKEDLPSSDSEDASSVNGTYTFNSATGSQSNGTITLSDGNFTYSGGRSLAPSSGTYTVSGSDITFSWTASGYSVSTTVTVSKSGSSVTLSSSEVLFFSTFFGSTAQSGGKYSLTFSYTE